MKHLKITFIGMYHMSLKHILDALNFYWQSKAKNDTVKMAILIIMCSTLLCITKFQNE